MHRWVIALCALYLCAWSPVTIIGGGVPAAGGGDTFTRFGTWTFTNFDTTQACTVETEVSSVTNTPNCDATTSPCSGCGAQYANHNSTDAAPDVIRFDSSVTSVTSGNVEWRGRLRANTLPVTGTSSLMSFTNAGTPSAELEMTTAGDLNIQGADGTKCTNVLTTDITAGATWYYVSFTYDPSTDIGTVCVNTDSYTSGSNCSAACDKTGTMTINGFDLYGCNGNGTNGGDCDWDELDFGTP